MCTFQSNQWFIAFVSLPESFLQGFCWFYSLWSGYKSWRTESALQYRFIVSRACNIVGPSTLSKTRIVKQTNVITNCFFFKSAQLYIESSNVTEHILLKKVLAIFFMEISGSAYFWSENLSYMYVDLCMLCICVHIYAACEYKYCVMILWCCMYCHSYFITECRQMCEVALWNPSTKLGDRRVVQMRVWTSHEHSYL